MFFRLFTRKEQVMANESQMQEPPSVEPERLMSHRLTDAQKRKIFFGIAAVITVIILANLFGPNSSAPATKSASASNGSQQTGPTPAQVAEFQANLRRTEEQFRQAEAEKEKAFADAKANGGISAADLQNAEALREANEARQQYERAHGGTVPGRQQLQTEREQQAYKSLFADNRVRQENGANSAGATQAVPQQPIQPRLAGPAAYPIADSQPRSEVNAERTSRKHLDFDPAEQNVYWLPEGTIVEAVLTNRLDGEQSGPVNAMVTTDVYLPGSRLLLIPAGARVLGEASKVSAFGQQRLAVAFHRLLVPGIDEYSVPLDKAMPGLAQGGEAALHDKVNNHYASIFGASLAIGAIGGLAQIGNSGSALSYDPSAQFRNGVSQSMAQSSDRVLEKFLNRMPAITIREGTRIKILLTDDLQVPAFNQEISRATTN
jgi:type IV secretory pathway VirB10-like protein